MARLAPRWSAGAAVGRQGLLLARRLVAKGAAEAVRPEEAWALQRVPQPWAAPEAAQRAVLPQAARPTALQSAGAAQRPATARAVLAVRPEEALPPRARWRREVSRSSRRTCCRREVLSCISNTRSQRGRAAARAQRDELEGERERRGAVAAQR